MVSLSLTRSGVTPGLPSPLPEFRPVSLQDTQQELLAKTVFGRDRGASVIEFSENVFRLKLEKHIDDYESGKGNRAPKISGEVLGRHLENTINLNSVSPEAGSAYAGYTGGFSYGQNARFKSGVNQATEQIRKVSEAYDKEEELSRFYNAVVEKVESSKAPPVQGAQSPSVDVLV